MPASARSGPPGPPAEITVGDVTSGDNPALELVRVARGHYRADLTLPRGEPGPPGNTITATAGHALSGHRIVTINDDSELVYAEPEDAIHRPLWLTTHAADEGATATAAATGFIDEPSWTWEPQQPLYLAANGVLSPEPPADTVIARVAVAVTPTRIFIDPQVPIALTA